MKHNVKVDSYNRFKSSTIELNSSEEYATIMHALDELESKMKDLSADGNKEMKRIYNNAVMAKKVIEDGIREAVR